MLLGGAADLLRDDDRDHCQRFHTHPGKTGSYQGCGFDLSDIRKTLRFPSMNLIKPMGVYLVFGVLLGIGTAKAMTGAPLILLVAGAIYAGLFIKYGCLGH